VGEEGASRRRRPSSAPSWLTAFLDLPATDFERTVTFWEGVTGFARSAARGELGEFATLVPRRGDDYLRVQQLGDGPARLHLDVHVDDPEVEAAGSVELRSPGGFVHCLVAHPASTVPPASRFPGVRRSRVYQVCLDIPSAAYDAEVAYWADLLDRRVEPLQRRPEFAWLRAAPGSATLALDVLLQRLDDSDGLVRAHFDLGTPDRTAEVARHEALGARVLSVEEFWTVMSDPAGLSYCVTDRDPASGSLI
jgi:hypothetical protein